ncbi:peptidyl-prolyl cis-trans isomerase [Winogradskyella alexanderae]|uniref:Peptidyl-prolyl cis-trans isomerase n=1 Tax=Winogradskyella alexanderae TaxID=2877123 RepID=A0ABS7XTW8_9FLAO|nr:peptidyl-prolyl cis-trans isomerase [Winogradskyella alexanderae]MCA0132352.1 peptidyl-prolyl cis-trans isomerase [Winogradskyella alexanderae]
MKYRLYILVLSSFLFSCEFFKLKQEEEAIARVNDVYLYKNDIKNLVPDGASTADSTLIVNQYINRWASQILLMEGALVNLNETKQEDFTKLVEQYKIDLFTKAYLDALVKKNIDTIVARDEAEIFYEANKESFKLNDDILQLRYVSLPQNPINLDTITMRFKRFNNDDKRYLDSISVQFKAYSLNDSLWVKYSQVVEKVSVVTFENKNQLLKKSNFIELKDSLNLYLMHVNDVKTQYEYAPLEYVNESIKQIVINKRKLELIKQLENEITKDAIRNKQFETYN